MDWIVMSNNLHGKFVSDCNWNCIQSWNYIIISWLLGVECSVRWCNQVHSNSTHAILNDLRWSIICSMKWTNSYRPGVFEPKIQCRMLCTLCCVRIMIVKWSWVCYTRMALLGITLGQVWKDVMNVWKYIIIKNLTLYLWI